MNRTLHTLEAVSDGCAVSIELSEAEIGGAAVWACLPGDTDPFARCRVLLPAVERFRPRSPPPRLFFRFLAAGLAFEIAATFLAGR